MYQGERITSSEISTYKVPIREDKNKGVRNKIIIQVRCVRRKYRRGWVG